MTGPLASTATCRIVTTGRRTGRPHAVTVWCCPVGATVYAPSRHGHQGDWLQNAIAAADVTVRRGRHEWSGRARVVTAPDEVARALDAFAVKYARHETVIASWRRSAPVFVAVDLTDPGAHER